MSNYVQRLSVGIMISISLITLILIRNIRVCVYLVKKRSKPVVNGKSFLKSGRTSMLFFLSRSVPQTAEVYTSFIKWPAKWLWYWLCPLMNGVPGLLLYTFSQTCIPFWRKTVTVDDAQWASLPWEFPAKKTPFGVPSTIKWMKAHIAVLKHSVVENRYVPFSGAVYFPVELS